MRGRSAGMSRPAWPLSEAARFRSPQESASDKGVGWVRDPDHTNPGSIGKQPCSHAGPYLPLPLRPGPLRKRATPRTVHAGVRHASRFCPARSPCLPSQFQLTSPPDCTHPAKCQRNQRSSLAISDRFKRNACDEAGAGFAVFARRGIDAAQHAFGKGDVQALGFP
jgi:hypothetical protein